MSAVFPKDELVSSLLCSSDQQNKGESGHTLEVSCRKEALVIDCNLTPAARVLMSTNSIQTVVVFSRLDLLKLFQRPLKKVLLSFTIAVRGAKSIIRAASRSLLHEV